MEENVEGTGALTEGFEKIVIEIQRALRKRQYETLTKKLHMIHIALEDSKSI